MELIINKIRMMIVFVIVVVLLVILLFDNDSLNSLLINNDNVLAINEINTLYVDYDKVAYNEVNVLDTNSSATVSNVSNTSSSNKSRWVWPTNKNYVITTYYSSYHRALDISGAGYGSGIYAANSGVVTSVNGGCIPGNTYCNGRGGNYIVINHQNGYYTVYMHLKDMYVKAGQSVSSGQMIGTMGNTGNVIPVPTSSNPYGGTHLHFCLYKGQPYKGGYEVNPMSVY